MSPLDLLELALQVRWLKLVLAAVFVILGLWFPETLNAVFRWVVEQEAAQITQRLTEWLEGIRVPAS